MIELDIITERILGFSKMHSATLLDSLKPREIFMLTSFGQERAVLIPILLWREIESTQLAMLRELSTEKVETWPNSISGRKAGPFAALTVRNKRSG